MEHEPDSGCDAVYPNNLEVRRPLFGDYCPVHKGLLRIHHWIRRAGSHVVRSQVFADKSSQEIGTVLEECNRAVSWALHDPSLANTTASEKMYRFVNIQLF